MVRITLATMLAKRVPLIQFRKGGAGIVASNSQSASPSQASEKAAEGKKANGSAIEDWELPARFARKPIDPVEAEYINNGGPK
ncbi:uncharacterized protein LOC115630852 isoform X1 [Scaptodrosophila lebanonensis]|uniref:Uncharacterized protein LOC115630852 isoform X1 n=1 Tax=Drosophila lebanonensis TaxID=7225 RepID=A0A6J2U743_DROLE|nr:uncharacterized protein LOC115630852 isoform X1 [Scaptodrosophila lebanonensis]